MISVYYQGKPFNIRVIQVYAPTSNTGEAEAEQFYQELQNFLELTPEKSMAPCSSSLAWKIPWTEEPGGLNSMGSLRVGYD